MSIETLVETIRTLINQKNGRYFDGSELTNVINMVSDKMYSELRENHKDNSVFNDDVMVFRKDIELSLSSGDKFEFPEDYSFYDSSVLKVNSESSGVVDLKPVDEFERYATKKLFKPELGHPIGYIGNNFIKVLPIASGYKLHLHYWKSLTKANYGVRLDPNDNEIPNTKPTLKTFEDDIFNSNVTVLSNMVSGTVYINLTGGILILDNGFGTITEYPNGETFRFKGESFTTTGGSTSVASVDYDIDNPMIDLDWRNDKMRDIVDRVMKYLGYPLERGQYNEAVNRSINEDINTMQKERIR
ncbi:MAG: hypothetical protein F6K19_01730 [Cyanothece sp. SIO1E1]|nr:hypothetical protein [Cyanothece sp. SIO1E1]